MTSQPSMTATAGCPSRAAGCPSVTRCAAARACLADAPEIDGRAHLRLYGRGYSRVDHAALVGVGQDRANQDRLSAVLRTLDQMRACPGQRHSLRPRCSARSTSTGSSAG